MTDFSVVGAGIGGLVAARALARGGARVVVHEASDTIGGTVRPHSVAGIRLDAGAESFAVRGGTVTNLLAELGLGDDIVTPEPGPAWVYREGAGAIPLPATALLGIPADPLAADVIAVIGEDAARAAAASDAEPGTISATSVGELVRQRYGAAVLDQLVAPVVHGVHSVAPDALPLARAHPRLADELAVARRLGPAVAALRAAAPAGSAVAGIRGGVHRIVEALVADLAERGVPIQTGSRVADPDALPGRVVWAAPPTGGRRVVLATLVVESAELDAAPRGSGVLVAPAGGGGGEGGERSVHARALTHATAKWAWLRDAAAGSHVVRLSYDVEPPTLADTARADASQLLGVDLPAPRGFARVEWTRPDAVEAPSVATVGESVAGSGIAGIVSHAQRLAAGLLAETSETRMDT